MAGLLVFRSLNDALKAGYQIYDRTSDGYLVRRRIGDRWEMAIVALRESQGLPTRVDASQFDHLPNTEEWR